MKKTKIKMDFFMLHLQSCLPLDNNCNDLLICIQKQQKLKRVININLFQFNKIIFKSLCTKK